MLIRFENPTLGMLNLNVEDARVLEYVNALNTLGFKPEVLMGDNHEN